MLNNIVREHQRKKQIQRQENEVLRKAAVESVALVTARIVDSVNTGVAHVFANQKTLEGEAKKLQVETSRFAKQTVQWLQTVEQFNNALKELGDVENWAKFIENDIQTIALSLEYVHAKNVPVLKMEKEDKQKEPEEQTKRRLSDSVITQELRKRTPIKEAAEDAEGPRSSKKTSIRQNRATRQKVDEFDENTFFQIFCSLVMVFSFLFFVVLLFGLLSGTADPRQLLDAIETLVNGAVYGGRMDSRAFRFNTARRTPDQRVDLTVDLKNVYEGSSMELRRERVVICPDCQGSGSQGTDVSTCPSCHGHGRVRQRQMGFFGLMEVENTCPRCKGRGKVIGTPCKTCQGHGLVQDRSPAKFTIKKGLAEGKCLVLAEEADMALGYNPGDLHVCLRTKSSEFQRFNDTELSTEITVSLLNALIGFDTDITHLDGHTVHLHRSEITQPNEVIVIEGEGMPLEDNESQRGNLHVRVNVRFPRSLNVAQQSKVKTILSN